MNLFQNSKILGGFNRIESDKPSNVLFSAFLVAFLGASGVQANIPANTHIEAKTESVAVASVCEEGGATEAITSVVTETAAHSSKKEKKDDDEELSPECETKKAVEDTLDSGTILVDETTGEIPALKNAKKKEQAAYEEKVAELEKLLKGYPLQKMAPEIAKQDPEIAALIVGIARKESQWGLRSPKKNGDCFNYWGFKGAGDRGVGMGHACFATREEAIEKIANRLERLVEKKGTSKPSALVTTWKCGSSCSGHSKESVNKWVSDVNQYYTRVLAMK